MRTFLIFIVLIFTTYIANAQRAQILNQDNSPIKIISFEASYQEDGRYTSEGLRYEILVGNDSEKEIVAYAVGFYAFDVFNRSLGRPLSGFSIETLGVNKQEEAAWLQRVSSASLFRKYGTAVSYVERVRFSDGVIWEYDSDAVLKQLQEFEESLSLEDLETERN